MIDSWIPLGGHRLLIGACAFALMSPFAMADPVQFDGHRIRAEWVLFYSAGGAETLYDGPHEATVGSGVEFSQGEFFNDIQWFDIDIGGSQIKIDNVHWTMNLVPAYFNGLRFTDIDGTLPAFTSISVNSATNLPIDQSRVWFTEDELFVNFQNLNIGSRTMQPTDELLVLDVSAEPVPEPGSAVLLGLAAIGYGIYRRRRKAV